jgi:hypothetical protein
MCTPLGINSFVHKKGETGLGAMAQAYNPSYLESRDFENHNSKFKRSHLIQ